MLKNQNLILPNRNVPGVFIDDKYFWMVKRDYYQEVLLLIKVNLTTTLILGKDISGYYDMEIAKNISVYSYI